MQHVLNFFIEPVKRNIGLYSIHADQQGDGSQTVNAG